MTRSEILRTAAEMVSGQRLQDYGKPENNFQAIATLWEAYLGINCVGGSDFYIDINAEDVAIMMTLFKIGRVSTGMVNIDNYIDAAGYMACAGEIASKEGVKDD